jgi:site-specific DNA-methyltransferase (adenine-specific)
MNVKPPRNQVIAGDCIEQLQKLPAGCVDLVFADPPFNIGYKYDVYDDQKSVSEYLDWSRQWMKEVQRVLAPSGTFWLAIGDDFVAELKVLAHRDIGFHLRNWVIWYYTFGVHCTKKFTRSHTHLIYFVQDQESFTFNDAEIRVPSARQLVYGDKRANPQGRLPDDTWILRPQDVPESFQAEGDTWYFPRVAGTFKQRAGFHGCQMPEQLLGRILTACSHPGDLVLDPFSGSGSTLVVAKKLNRTFLGFELSTDYVGQIEARLTATKVGQPLDGDPDPLTSAPSTKNGKRLKTAKKAHKNSKTGASAKRKPETRKQKKHPAKKRNKKSTMHAESVETIEMAASERLLF